MSRRARRKHTPGFKVKVALAASSAIERWRSLPSRRLIKCAKESGHYFAYSISPLFLNYSLVFVIRFSADTVAFPQISHQILNWLFAFKSFCYRAIYFQI